MTTPKPKKPKLSTNMLVVLDWLYQRRGQPTAVGYCLVPNSSPGRTANALVRRGLAIEVNQDGTPILSRVFSAYNTGFYLLTEAGEHQAAAQNKKDTDATKAAVEKAARAEPKLRMMHIRTAIKRWDAAVEEIRRVLNYQNHHDPNDWIARKLAHRFLTLPSMTMFRVLGCDDQNLRGFPVPYTPVDRLEFVAQFINYEILDDGYPGIDYYRTGGLSFERCMPDHPDARPYFCRNVDADRPDAEALTAKRALEILEQEAALQIEQDAQLRKNCSEPPEQHEHDTEQRELELLTALADELQEKI